MAEQAKLEESNMANYGGEDHRNAARAAAETEKAYRGAGKVPGLQIWRVENRRTDGDKPNFGVNKWPQDQYGEFFDGDSYIVLNTYKKKDSDALLWDMHFWLGKDTTQDEKGVAAYKTVELDDLLNDGPIQHRETMGNESGLFQSYFNGGITYLSGGIASGFRKVRPEQYVPRLLEIKRAKRTTRAIQVECSVNSMNKSDCYVLDLGTKVYKYLGPNASPFEKSRAAHIASNIVNGRQGKAKQVNIGDDESFWETVGGSESDLADDASDERKAERNAQADGTPTAASVKVFRISDEGGNINFEMMTHKSSDGYSRFQLEAEDVFIVDNGMEIFIWKGSKSSKREKSQAWKLVDQYINDNGVYSATPVTVIDEGKMNPVFDACFVEGFVSRT